MSIVLCSTCVSTPFLISFPVADGEDLVSLFMDFMYHMCIPGIRSVYRVCIPPKKSAYLALAVIRTIPRTGPVPPGPLVGALPFGGYETRSHPGDFQHSSNTKHNVARDCTALHCAALHCYPPPFCASTAFSKHLSPCYCRFDEIF